MTAIVVSTGSITTTTIIIIIQNIINNKVYILYRGLQLLINLFT